MAVRVKPRAARDHVGGSWGAAGALVVAVAAPAVEGRANEAVTRVLARALGVRPWQVTVVSGRRSRDKVVEVSDPPVDLDARVADLRTDP